MAYIAIWVEYESEDRMLPDPYETHAHHRRSELLRERDHARFVDANRPAPHSTRLLLAVAVALERSAQALRRFSHRTARYQTN
jgi:hypothetical protein